MEVKVNQESMTSNYHVRTCPPLVWPTLFESRRCPR